MMKRPHQTECQQIVQTCDPRENRAENWTKSWRHRTIQNTQAGHSDEHWDWTKQQTLNRLTDGSSKHTCSCLWTRYLGSFSALSGYLPLYGGQWDKMKHVNLTDINVSKSLTTKSSNRHEMLQGNGQKATFIRSTFPVSCAGEQMHHFLMIKHHMSEPANAFLFFIDFVSEINHGNIISLERWLKINIYSTLNQSCDFYENLPFKYLGHRLD